MVVVLTGWLVSRRALWLASQRARFTVITSGMDVRQQVLQVDASSTTALRNGSCAATGTCTIWCTAWHVPSCCAHCTSMLAAKHLSTQPRSMHSHHSAGNVWCVAWMLRLAAHYQCLAGHCCTVGFSLSVLAGAELHAAALTGQALLPLPRGKEATPCQHGGLLQHCCCRLLRHQAIQLGHVCLHRGEQQSPSIAVQASDLLLRLWVPLALSDFPTSRTCAALMHVCFCQTYCAVLINRQAEQACHAYHTQGFCLECLFRTRSGSCCYQCCCNIAQLCAVATARVPVCGRDALWWHWPVLWECHCI